MSKILGGRIFPNKNNVNFQLHVGNGPRSFTENISFSKAFNSKPKVIVWICGQDVETGLDHRLNVFPSDIDTKGFTLNISTWKDTHVYGAGACWLAYDSSFEQHSGEKLMHSGTSTVKQQLTAHYTLHKGHGDRKVSTNVVFDKPFASAPPIIFVSLSQLDIDNGNKKRDARLSCTATNITKEGFTIDFDTWNDTWIYSAACSWFAFDQSMSNSPSSKIRIETNKQPYKKDHGDFTLLKGKGSRQVSRKVTFSPTFKGIPTVLEGEYMIDLISAHDARIAFSANGIGSGYFKLNADTWSDSEIWGAGAAWLAFEVTGSDDDTEEETEPANSEPPAKKQKTESPNKSSTTTTTTTTTTSGSPVAPAAAHGESTTGESKECKVCMDKNINTVLIPCGHLCVCLDCANELTKVKSQAHCPICNSKITKVQKAFLS